MCAVVAAMTACERQSPEQPPASKVGWTNDVAPILLKHCAECHATGGAGAEATGFVVDSYADVMQGSQYGPVIEPGHSRTSSLYILITGKEHLTVSMPHGGRAPLSEEEIETLRIWIDSGAPEN